MRTTELPSTSGQRSEQPAVQRLHSTHVCIDAVQRHTDGLEQNSLLRSTCNLQSVRDFPTYHPETKQPVVKQNFQQQLPCKPETSLDSLAYAKGSCNGNLQLGIIQNPTKGRCPSWYLSCETTSSHSFQVLVEIAQLISTSY